MTKKRPLMGAAQPVEVVGWPGVSVTVSHTASSTGAPVALVTAVVNSASWTPWTGEKVSVVAE